MSPKCFFLWLGLFLFKVVTANEPAKPHSTKETFKQYCFDCHDNDKQQGNVNFETLLTDARSEKSLEQWVKAWDVLKNDLMPPAHKKQLSNEDKAAVIAWIQKEEFKYDPLKPDPGKVVIRRLNREEFNNTVNDLFNIKMNLKEEFPADDAGFGFDNIGSVLTTSPLLTEKYINASEKILERLFPNENPESTKKNIPLSLFKGNLFPGGGDITLVSNYEINYTDEIIYEGEYEYTVMASGDQVGADLVKMKIGVKNISDSEFTVTTKRGTKEKHIFKVKLKPGDNQFFIGFLNDFYQPDDPNPKNRDRNLIVHSVLRTGPINPVKGQKSDFEELWLSELKNEKNPNTYAKLFLTKFMPKAYRRNIAEEELRAKIAFFVSIYEQTKSLKESLKWTIQSILLSPHFLFKDETINRPVSNNSGAYLISEYALANKLSYFFWSSMPDDKLFELAKTNQLRKNLKTEVMRLLKSPKSISLTKNFLGQWLQLRDLDLKAPAYTAFPKFNRNLIKDALAETEEYFSYIVAEDRSILELIDSNYTFLNQRLSQHYEIANVKGNEFRKVELTDKRRGGLLTQMSILLITSYPTRTSLVLRGKYILENLLGYTPPSPPPEMPSLADKENTKDKTLRERIQLHAANETCASCHAKFDPMGYALESFDGVGKWRTEDNGQPLDTKGKLLTGESFEGVVELKEVLLKNKKDLFTKCLIKKLMIYGLGRGLQYYDEVEVENILATTIKQNYKFSEIMLAIVNSTPFQKHRDKNE
jgi:hypothetical protein